jgi:hypothetical protein
LSDTETPFESWAIVELMGHRRLGGYVRAVELAGAAMLRIDVPELAEPRCTCWSHAPESGNQEDHQAGCMLFAPSGAPPSDIYATQFYSASALYCLTPTTEQAARAIATRTRPTPAHRWELEPAPVRTGDVEIRDEFLEDDEDGQQF